MFEFIAVFIISYFWHAMGVTIGYHRLLAHRSFSCPKAVEYFWVLGGYLAFEGSPIWWTTIHRAHHRYSDTPRDPHSPKNGLWNSFAGWLAPAEYASYMNPNEQAPDLIKDPVYRFLEQSGRLHAGHALALGLCLAFRVIVLLCFGWQVALASLLAGLVVLQLPLILNVVCHIPALGYKNYLVKDDSVNVWWMAIFSMGEGWHNNHHASPGSAKTGMRLWEVDISWMTICLMKRLGLVGRINAASHERLSKTHNLKTLKLVAPKSSQSYAVSPELARKR